MSHPVEDELLRLRRAAELEARRVWQAARTALGRHERAAEEARRARTAATARLDAAPAPAGGRAGALSRRDAFRARARAGLDRAEARLLDALDRVAHSGAAVERA